MIISFDDDDIRAGYTRVSSILKPLAQFVGVDEDVLKAASIRGTAIHKAIQLDAQGIPYPMPIGYRGYFKSYRKWCDVTQFRIERSELRLYDDDLHITGGLDAIVTNGENRYLVDWKNTAAQNRDYWELQGMFYHYLAAQNGIKLHKKIMFIQLCPEGSPAKVFSFEASEVLWRQCLKYYFMHVKENPLSIIAR
jgi:hypothetical protein